jgi:hypothetical protein
MLCPIHAHIQGARPSGMAAAVLALALDENSKGRRALGAEIECNILFTGR